MFERLTGECLIKTLHAKSLSKMYYGSLKVFSFIDFSIIENTCYTMYKSSTVEFKYLKYL